MKRLMMWLPVLVMVASAGAVAATGPGEKVKTKCQWTMSVEYPRFNHPPVDDTIQAWLGGSVKGSMQAWLGDGVGISIINAAEDMAGTGDPEFELAMEVGYETVQASSGVISIAFTITDFPFHAVHPSASIATLNMSADDGGILTLDALFADTEKALAIISECARQTVADDLRKEFSGGSDVNIREMIDSDWFRDGSAPTRDNFSAFTVAPDGVRVYFQQYQILPYFLGMPDALIPLEKLESAGPNRKFWPAMPATER